jgi:hypothetical protein
VYGENIVPQDTLRVDDEKSTEGDTTLLDEDAVISGDFHVTVCKERQPEIWTEATLLTGLVSPRKVGILGVGGHSKDLSIELLELGEGIIEGEDLRWADKGKVPEVYESTQLSAPKFLHNVHWVEE